MSELKKRNPKLKLLLGIGGPHETAERYWQLLPQMHLYRDMTISIGQWVKTYGLDGIVLDFFSGARTAHDSEWTWSTAKFIEPFVWEIRQRFKEYKPKWHIILTLPAFDSSTHHLFDINKLSDQVNFFFVKSSDCLQFPRGAGLNISRTMDMSDIDRIELIVKRGAERTRVVPEIPLSARTYSATGAGFGRHTVFMGRSGNYTKQQGFLSSFEANVIMGRKYRGAVIRSVDLDDYSSQCAGKSNLLKTIRSSFDAATADMDYPYNPPTASWWDEDIFKRIPTMAPPPKLTTTTPSEVSTKSKQEYPGGKYTRAMGQLETSSVTVPTSNSTTTLLTTPEEVLPSETTIAPPLNMIVGLHLVACAFLISRAAAAEQKPNYYTLCFWDGFSRWRPEPYNSAVGDIPAELCNAVVYSHVTIDEKRSSIRLTDMELQLDPEAKSYSNSWIYNPIWLLPPNKIFAQMRDLKRRNSKLKLLLAVGGPHDPVEKYWQLFPQVYVWKDITASLIQWLRTYDFDGVVLDFFSGTASLHDTARSWDNAKFIHPFVRVCSHIKSGWTRERFGEEACSFLKLADQYVAYEDAESVSRKARMVMGRQYRGAAIRSVDLGDYNGMCSEKSHLVKAIRSTLDISNYYVHFYYDPPNTTWWKEVKGKNSTTQLPSTSTPSSEPTRTPLPTDETSSTQPAASSPTTTFDAVASTAQPMTSSVPLTPEVRTSSAQHTTASVPPTPKYPISSIKPMVTSLPPTSKGETSSAQPTTSSQYPTTLVVTSSGPRTTPSESQTPERTTASAPPAPPTTPTYRPAPAVPPATKSEGNICKGVQNNKLLPHESDCTRPPDYELKLLMICAVVISACVTRMLSMAWRLPKITVSVACGLLLGVLAGPDTTGLGSEASSIPVYASMYVPAVTYTVTIQMPYHVLYSCAVTCLTLGTVGLLLSALLNGLLLHTARLIDIPTRDLFYSSLLMSYQEPMAISDVIMPSPCVATWFAWFVLGSLVLGKAVGHAMAYVLDHLHYEATLMCSLSLASVYITYYLADLFMFRGGMLGVIAMGLTMKSCATSSAMTDDEPFLRFWSTYRYVLCVLLTFLASMRVGRDLMHIRNYGRPVYMPTVYCMIRLSNRVITVVVLFPVLRRTGCQLSARQAMVLAWVTLKGPVTMVALSTRALGALGYMDFVAERLCHLLSVVESCLIPAFTVTPLMRFLGMLHLDAPESARVRRSMKSIWEAAAKSRERQRAKRNFSGADWKWIEEHIYLADLLSLGYQLVKVERQEPVKPARKTTLRKMSNRLNRMTKVMFKDEFTERLGSSICVLPSRGHPVKAYAEVNRNIRTLQTKDKVLSALPEPSESSTWSTSGLGSELLSPGQVASNRLRRTQVCILFNALGALSLAALLAGVLVAALEYHSLLFTTASVALQGCILLLHSVELVTMYSRSPTASFLAVDAWARLDLAAYLAQLVLFCVSAWCSASDTPLHQCWPPVAMFVALAACRAHKFWVHRRCRKRGFTGWTKAINQRVFRMYDMAVAFINSEEEVVKSSASVPSIDQVTVFMREEASYNKLELLKEIIRIQQRYPQLECVARSRLVARRILNSTLSALNDLHESGLVEEHHYTELVTLYCWKYNKGKQLVSYGKPHQAIHIVFSGIVKIEGKQYSASRRLPLLANADSLQFFKSGGPFTDFLVAPGTLGIVGFLNRSDSVCDVICETDIEACVIPMWLMDKLVARDGSTPCILYRMWQWVAVRVALDLLHGREEFEGVDPDALRRYVEDGRLPYLGRARSVVLDDDVDCAVLVQGSMCTQGQSSRVFFGPQFVPESVRYLDISGDPDTRPLPVLLLLCKHRYRLPNELDWQNMPGELFSNEPEYRTRTITKTGRRRSLRASAARRR
ncbi:hypothetical protein HPB50_026898 [Hyalomma asiaticum]|uniref:Uncharacterized protein n=1 Tax=Hyalomma asiaticum TaxID=266040 RepID=A0ACB7RZ92_HYAAI|nr:hypothetical protein HPB50_026898 [Hyalomma asiaticum]